MNKNQIFKSIFYKTYVKIARGIQKIGMLFLYKCKKPKLYYTEKSEGHAYFVLHY